MALIERTEAAQRALEAALGRFPTGGGYQLAADVLAAADAAEASQLQGAVAENEKLRGLLTEAHRQDYGTPGWRDRVRRALGIPPVRGR